MNDRTSGISEENLAKLVRRGGARAQPPAAAREAVRTAVRAEWQAVVAERSRQSRTRWSLAAAAAVAGLAVWLAVPMLQAPAVAVATVERVNGPVEIGGRSLFGGFSPVRSGASVVPGDEIRSRPGGRLALRVGELSLRLDQDSAMIVLAADRVELRRGALYVDSGGDATSGNRLRVATPFGDVSHVGTQYETRLMDDSLRVRVREGRVRIAVREGGVADGAAGQQLTFGQGAVHRAAIDRASTDWSWAGEIAPAYELENRSLAQFLSWVGRETGREVVFDSPASQAEAQRIVLRGSTAGLSPERALAAVMSTTRLGHGESAGQLFIEFRTGETR